MSRKKIILIIVAVFAVIVILGGIGYFSTRAPSGDTEGGGSVSPELFPENDEDAEFGGSDIGEVSLPEGGAEATQNAGPPVFRQISSSPISGYAVFDDGGTTTIRYAEKETGHIFETFGDSLETERLSNTTVPRVRETLWFGDGEAFVMRYADKDDNVETFLSRLQKKEGDEFYSFSSEALPRNILAGDIFGDEFFAVLENGDSSVWRIFNASGKETVLVSNPLKEWLVDFWSDASVSIETRPSNGIGGYLYFLDTKTLSLREVLGNVSGLTSKTSPDGKYVFYSSSAGSVNSSFIYETKSGKSNFLSIKTLSDKCGWSSEDELYCGVPETTGGDLPDLWYQGLVSFSDSIWKIDPETLEAEIILNLLEQGRLMDIKNITVEKNFLYFMDKKDSSLWSLDLSR